MVAWYECLHPWNRITLGSFLLALAITAVFGTFTLERIVAAPLSGMAIWTCGWATIGAWGLVRRLGVA